METFSLTTPFMELMLALAVILILAKAAGYVSNRFHQPSVLGELLIGIILGPSLLNFLNWPIFKSGHVLETIHQFSEIGVLLLMFVAGLELHLADLARNMKVSVLAGAMGVLVPVILGWSTGMLFGFGGHEALFLGLTLGATSVSISAQTLIELKVLRTRVGLGLLGSAVLDDILVILLLSIFLALVEGSGGIVSVLWVFLRMLAFLGLSLAVGLWLLPFLTKRVSRLPISQGVLTLAIVIMFLYGLAAEILGGMAAITGAFLAGLMFARSSEKERLERGFNSISYSLFVPIFFVNIGLAINIRQLDINDLWLLIAITLVAFVGKFVGSGLGAAWGGFSRRESLILGAGMVSRGEVGLILASVGITGGFMTPAEFTAIVGMVLLTTLITPPLLRYLIKAPEKRMLEQTQSEGD
jgi:Kef-type K+ transport system membrane component KefB